jgi:hypothetical protein
MIEITEAFYFKEWTYKEVNKKCFSCKPMLGISFSGDYIILKQKKIVHKFSSNIHNPLPVRVSATCI